MDISGVRSVYCIGIKGAGVAALAQLFAARGVRVSGSDVAQRFFTQEGLDRAGIAYVEGFAAENVPCDVDLVVHSSAYGDTHVEVAAARAHELRVLAYPEALAAIFNAGTGIAVCGTHGKTTTTAMLGHILIATGRDPSVIVGSTVPEWGSGARAGASDLVVLEADEYQDKLRFLNPHGVVLLNVEYDHPDAYPTFDAYRDAFARFVARIPADGFLIVSEPNDVTRAIAAHARCPVTFCEDTGAPIALALPGAHNVRNARAAIAAAGVLGVAAADATAALATFHGTKRRFEVLGEHDGTVIVDDYAHHPSEIRATIAAAAERYPGRRIIVAFQPHTYTRTIALKDDFATAFTGAAHVFVMDIFGSAREAHGGITAAELAATLNVPASASGDIEATVSAVRAAIASGDVVLCLGAGRNDEVARALVGGAAIAGRGGDGVQ